MKREDFAKASPSERAADSRKRLEATAPERFWAKVEPAAADECWVWTASKTPTGYGKFTAWYGCTVKAYRWSYEYLIASVPDGLELDHLCRNRACVNPYHLEPVTHRVNAQRGTWIQHGSSPTHCKNGHLRTPENTYHSKGSGPSGSCRTCVRASQAKRRKAMVDGRALAPKEKAS